MFAAPGGSAVVLRNDVVIRLVLDLGLDERFTVLTVILGIIIVPCEPVGGSLDDFGSMIGSLFLRFIICLRGFIGSSWGSFYPSIPIIGLIFLSLLNVQCIGHEFG
jgi:hypothetical protein